MQKKFLKQLNLDEIDYTITEIKNNKCLESYYKNNEVTSAIKVNKFVTKLIEVL